MHADHTTTPANATPPVAGRRWGRVASAAAATAALGGAAAVSADPALAGAAAVLADAPAWLTPALAGAAGLAGLRTLLALRTPRPAAARSAESAAAAEIAPEAAAAWAADDAAVADGGAGVAEPAAPAEPPRRAVVDPSAVFPIYSAAAPDADGPIAAGEPADDEATAENGDLLPFPSADPAAQTGWEYDADGDDEEVAAADGDADDGAPATIRFEDVPSSVTVGARTIDLTEAADADLRHDALKGLTKKEKRTVRNALRDRERLLRRAA